MGNPYPAQFSDEDGTIRLNGDVTFTDPANQPGGGVAPGGAVTMFGPFVFAFDTPGLTDGIPFYTPAVDEIMVSLGIEVVIPWNQVSSLADVGQLIGVNTGLFNATLIASPGLFVNVNAHVIFDTVSITSPTLSEGGNFYRFTSTDPLQVWVSHDGTAGGASPGATQGVAHLYATFVTPIPFP